MKRVPKSQKSNDILPILFYLPNVTCNLRPLNPQYTTYNVSVFRFATKNTSIYSGDLISGHLHMGNNWKPNILVSVFKRFRFQMIGTKGIAGLLENQPKFWKNVRFSNVQFSYGWPYTIAIVLNIWENMFEKVLKK